MITKKKNNHKKTGKVLEITQKIFLSEDLQELNPDSQQVPIALKRPKIIVRPLKLILDGVHKKRCQTPNLRLLSKTKFLSFNSVETNKEQPKMIF